jgi:hypothetical protein
VIFAKKGTFARFVKKCRSLKWKYKEKFAVYKGD